MQATETTNSYSEIMADLCEVCRQAAAGGVVRDPELLRRVEDRAEQIRNEIQAAHGLVDIGAELIREARETRP